VGHDDAANDVVFTQQGVVDAVPIYNGAKYGIVCWQR
jgi:hypothetical protein